MPKNYSLTVRTAGARVEVEWFATKFETGTAALAAILRGEIVLGWSHLGREFNGTDCLSVNDAVLPYLNEGQMR